MEKDVEAFGQLINGSAGCPPLAGLLQVDDADEKERLKQTTIAEFARPDGQEVKPEEMTPHRVFEIACELATAFGVAGVAVSAFGNGASVDIQHFRALFSIVTTAQTLALCLLRTAYLCEPADDAAESDDHLYEACKAGAKKSPNRLPAMSQAVVQSVVVLRNAIASAEAVAKSESHEEPALHDIRCDMPIVKFRTISAMSMKYLEKVEAWLVRKYLGKVNARSQVLKAMCPQWTVWVTDDIVDDEKLEGFRKNFAKAKVKSGVLEIHADIVKVKNLARQFWPCADLKSMAQCGIATMAQDVDQVHTFAMQSLALHSCAMVLAAEPSQQKNLAASVCASMKQHLHSMPLPKSVVKKITDLAS